MFKGMKTYANRKPGQKRTRRLAEKQVDKLLYVRYRYDVKCGLRLKTVEIIVEEKGGANSFRFRDNDLVSVMVPYTKEGLLEMPKAAGGRWDLEVKLYRVRNGSIRNEVGLFERIVRG